MHFSSLMASTKFGVQLSPEGMVTLKLLMTVSSNSVEAFPFVLRYRRMNGPRCDAANAAWRIRPSIPQGERVIS
jgi:hypothetical protein